METPTWVKMVDPLSAPLTKMGCQPTRSHTPRISATFACPRRATSFARLVRTGIPAAFWSLHLASSLILKMHQSHVTNQEGGRTLFWLGLPSHYASSIRVLRTWLEWDSSDYFDTRLSLHCLSLAAPLMGTMSRNPSSMDFEQAALHEFAGESFSQGPKASRALKLKPQTRPRTYSCPKSGGGQEQNIRQCAMYSECRTEADVSARVLWSDAPSRFICCKDLKDQCELGSIYDSMPVLFGNLANLVIDESSLTFAFHECAEFRNTRNYLDHTLHEGLYIYIYIYKHCHYMIIKA